MQRSILGYYLVAGAISELPIRADSTADGKYLKLTCEKTYVTTTFYKNLRAVYTGIDRTYLITKNDFTDDKNTYACTEGNRNLTRLDKLVTING